MKNAVKFFGIAALAVVIGFTMTVCGGGGGGGAKKSGLSTNGFFGALPAIYADNNLADDAIREKHKAAKEKAEKKQNAKAYQKAGDQFDKDLEELSDKLKTNVDAECAKLAGKEVPFTASDNFREFKVESLKVDATGNIAMTTSDVRKNMMGVTSFKFKAVAKDGTVIIDHMGYGSEKLNISGEMRNRPEKWLDFEKIEFSNAQ